MPIGIQLPPSAEKRKRSDDEDNSDSEDEVGPSLPPSESQAPDLKKPRTIGPSLPPSLATAGRSNPRKEDSSDDDDDDDDDFGPALPPQKNAEGITSNGTESTKEINSSAPAPKPQVARDEWMTMAPKGGDWSQRVDPTKLKSRKFNTGRSNPTTSSGSDSWHETPEQKQARLKRQVLGTKDNGESAATSAKFAETSQDSETAKRIEEYNKQRGPSLYDAHRKKHEDGLDDDPSARAFDKEKDMGVGLQMNSTKRREMLKKSADFNSRFSSAKYS